MHGSDTEKSKTALLQHARDSANLHGREIGAQDGRGAPGAAVVNETLARRLWPGSDALGRTLRLDDETIAVVGIARDSKNTR